MLAPRLLPGRFSLLCYEQLWRVEIPSLPWWRLGVVVMSKEREQFSEGGRAGWVQSDWVKGE